jgi:N-acyl-D-aspartate/D-glutamate deacylase
MSFLTTCALWHIPGWRAVLNVEVPERIRRLKDPAVRADMLEKAQVAPWDRFSDFARYVIGDVATAQNERYRNRNVGEIANERGQDPFATIVDIAAADDLKTVLWPPSEGDSDADWELRSRLWDEPDVLLGASDAGAHLDRMLGSPYPSRFLAESLRGRRLVSMERAVHLMTDAPARFFGLRSRGRLERGYCADVVIFDPATIGSGPARSSFDLPGGSKRLVADPVGIVAVLVNGEQILADGEPTGSLPGTVLRAGRDATEAAR